jgi:small GTP-binding protein
MQKSAPTRRIKIVTLGDSSTGKSSLIKRYCERRFDKRNNSTVALDYGSIQVNIRASEKDDSNLVYVDFWDLSGKPEYLSVRSECYLPCPSAALLVYDVNNRASFESLEEWLKELRRQGVNKNDNVPITLCANKIDGIQRAVTRRDGMTFKEKHKLHSYFEVSAIEGTSVDVMFRSLFESAVGS